MSYLRVKTAARRVVLFAAMTSAIATVPTQAKAQERLGAQRRVAITPTFDQWSFGDGLIQTTVRGDTVRVTRATQLAVPIAAELWFGDRWQLDISGAVVDGTVKLQRPDAAIGENEYALRGVTDVKVGVTAHVVPDRVLITAGYTAALGGSELEPGEIEAIRVFAAPALSLQVPTLGLGQAVTAGFVLATPLGRWAGALGGSYEHRASSTPLVIASGFPALDFAPSDAIHVSLGAEGLVGPHGMTFGLSADIFSDDEYSSGGQPITSAGTRLGPIYTAEWQMRVASARFRELTLFVTDRYRTRFRRAGESIPESSGNYLDLGATSVAPLSPRSGLVVNVALRHHTGLAADSAVASAAARMGVATLGLRYNRGSYVLQPTVTAQLGRLDTGLATADVRGVSGGVSLSRRF